MYGIADAWFTLDAEAPRIAAIGAICARAIVSHGRKSKKDRRNSVFLELPVTTRGLRIEPLFVALLRHVSPAQHDRLALQCYANAE